MVTYSIAAGGIVSLAPGTPAGVAVTIVRTISVNDGSQCIIVWSVVSQMQGSSCHVIVFVNLLVLQTRTLAVIG